MRLGEYYRGKRLTFVSRLSAAEAARRLNDATISRFRPFATGVIGWAKLGFISLKYRPGYFRNDLRPVLVGSIRDAGGGSRLELRYRAPLGMYVAPLFWGAFVFIFPAFIVGTQKGSGGTPAAVLTFIFLALLMLAIPAVQIHTTLKKADAELERLVAFITDNAGATVLQRG